MKNFEILYQFIGICDTIMDLNMYILKFVEEKNISIKLSLHVE